jgi:membrane-associated protease RseP (regulator of RpoE activity)
MTDTLLPSDPVPSPAAPAPIPKGHPGRLAILAGLVLLAGWRGGWALLVVIAALVVMIFLHELGHYLTAKSAGMKVTEFFIGFGPRIWSFQRGETEYGLKVIPAGAYVKIIGMHNLDEFDPADADRTYMSKPFWRRISVAVAGSTMHFLLALVCFFVAFAFVGLPGGSLISDEGDLNALEARVGWNIDRLTPGSAAEQAGLESGDRVVSIDGVETPTFGAFGDAVRDRPGETVVVVYERNGEVHTAEATIGVRDGDGTGFFGVGSDFDALAAIDSLPRETVGLGTALGNTVESYRDSVTQTFRGLGQILSPSGLSQLGSDAFTPTDQPEGPVVGNDGSVTGSSSSGDDHVRASSIVGISGVGASLLDGGNVGYFLALFATINIFIGVFNLVPLLPLDGGHVAIAVYEKFRSMRLGRDYHVDVVKLLPVTYAAVLVLAFLGISTIVLDTRSLLGS